MLRVHLLHCLCNAEIATSIFVVRKFPSSLILTTIFPCLVFSLTIELLDTWHSKEIIALTLNKNQNVWEYEVNWNAEQNNLKIGQLVLVSHFKKMLWYRVAASSFLTWDISDHHVCQDLSEKRTQDVKISHSISHFSWDIFLCRCSPYCFTK